MRTSLAKKLAAVEVRSVKCQIQTEGGALQEVSYIPGALVDAALAAAQITRGQAAGHMGISESLLARQIHNADHQHLSWQRLFSLPDAFWREMLILIAEKKRIADIKQELTITILRKAG